MFQMRELPRSKFPSVVLSTTGCLCLVIASTAAHCYHKPADFPIPGIIGPYNNTTDPTNDSASYVGSDACSACHGPYAEIHASHGHTQAFTNMGRIYDKINKLSTPPVPSQDVNMQIWCGLRNAGTPYPETLVVPRNFESETHILEVSGLSLLKGPIFPAFVHGALFWVIVFDNPRGPMFWTTH